MLLLGEGLLGHGEGRLVTKVPLGFGAVVKARIYKFVLSDGATQVLSAFIILALPQYGFKILTSHVSQVIVGPSECATTNSRLLLRTQHKKN